MIKRDRFLLAGAEVITVTVAGNPPKVAVGQDVLAVELEAIPCMPAAAGYGGPPPPACSVQ